MTKHTPATPLPWKYDETRAPTKPLTACNGAEWIGMAFRRVGEEEDFRYVAHTANNYPALVAAIQDLLPLARVGFVELGEGDEVIGRARKALNDAGEELE